MAIFGDIRSIGSNLNYDDNFKIAFDYLGKCLKEDSDERIRILSMNAGDVNKKELGNGVFAMEQCYLTKDREEGKFESHRKYVDIQAVIKGEERIEYTSIDGLEIETPYDGEADIAWYLGGDGIGRGLSAGMFAVFYPDDAHKPALTDKERSRVFKTVVKVPADS